MTILLSLTAFACLTLLQPVTANSTDLWYHLAGGRYLFEQGALYNPYVVSFLEPKAHFTNYFWGFQAVVYGLWLVVGDYAPVVLRALLMIPCAYLMLKLLHQDDLRRVNSIHMVLTMLLVYMLTLRLGAVRPHLATLLFIAAFLYIMLYREKWFPCLPLLAIFWVNLHGVGWAIGAVICGSYFVTQLVCRWQLGRPLKPSLWWVVACAPAILVNPWGIYVLPTPFLTEQSLSLLIGELRPLELNLNWPVAQGLAYHPTIVVLLGFYFTALFTLRREWLQHLFPILISLASFALFLRGQRFVWECMLLCTPMLAIYAARFNDLGLAKARFIVSAVTSGILLFSLHTVYEGKEAYPIGYVYPEGTTAFLKEKKLNTEYALPPTLAGYAEWHLTPGYQIHSDMHFPPFTAAKHFEIRSIQYSKASLKRFVESYRPGLIAVYVESAGFADIARSQDYRPIMFDHRLVLYASATKLPELVNKYELTAINPFDPYKIAGNYLDIAEQEMRRAIQYDPKNHVVRSVLADVLIEQGRLQEAEALLLEEFVAVSGRLQFQKGRLCRAREDFSAASLVLEQAYRTLQETKVGLLAADSAFVSGNPDHAYDLYAAVLNPYLDVEYDLKHIYQYALSALLAGKVSRARDLYDVMVTIDGHNDVNLSDDMRQLDNLIKEQE